MAKARPATVVPTALNVYNFILIKVGVTRAHTSLVRFLEWQSATNYDFTHLMPTVYVVKVEPYLNKFFSVSEVASMLTLECHLPCPVQFQNEILRWRSLWQRIVYTGNAIPITKKIPNIYSLLCIACVLPITSY